MFAYRVFGRAILVLVAIWWCVVFVRRFPRDLSELREKYGAYRTRNDPYVLGVMQTAEKRRRYQQNSATEFWTVLLIDALLWLATTGIAVFLILFAVYAVVQFARFVGPFR